VLNAVRERLAKIDKNCKVESVILIAGSKLIDKGMLYLLF
jgi:hypothetical protein